MKIIINRSDAIGYSVLTSSMAKMIKDKFSDAYIIYLISPTTADLFKNSAYIDEVRVYNRKQAFFKKMKFIYSLFREIRPTHYFYVGGGFFPNFMAWLFGVPFRGGQKLKWHTYLFLNKGIRQSRGMVSMHEMEYNLNLLGPMGLIYYYTDKEKFLPEINLLEKEVAEAQDRFKHELALADLQTDLKYVVIHPGLNGQSLNWGARNYGRLILQLDKKLAGKYFYVISYATSDKDAINNIRAMLEIEASDELKKRYTFFDGSEKGLRNYMSILKNASLYIGANSGITHIAATLKVPVVALYSPIKNQSVYRWGPLSSMKDKVKTIVPDVICGETHECALKECPYYECMEKIEVEDVISKATSIMDL